MEKANFFGRCLGQKVLYTSSYYVNLGEKTIFDFAYPYPRFDNGEVTWQVRVIDMKEKLRHDIFDEIDLCDCQIIGRRIQDMTDEETQKFFLLYHTDSDWKVREDNPNVYPVVISYALIKEKCIDYLFDIGIFPDKYFDELKWCVEEK